MNTVHCLFEQSGTFKKEFIKLGYKAIDYDIQNEFGQTDYEIDLFNEIEKGYKEEKSIFDNITSDDFIFAFFPCTYFSGQNNLYWSKSFRWFKTWTTEKVDKYIQERLEKRDLFYSYLVRLVSICNKRKISLMIENPYKGSALINHYTEFPDPSIVIMNRRELGDKMVKPTMFFSFNFTPRNNKIEILENKHKQVKSNDLGQTERSMITQEFASNFIKKYILGEEEVTIFDFLD